MHWCSANRALPAVLALTLAACAARGDSAAATRPTISPVDAAAASITPEDVRRHVAFLASDALKGRETPSPGLDSAAAYVAREFATLGLRPAGDSTGFLQRYSLQNASLTTERVRLRLSAGDVTADPGFGREFFVFPARTDSLRGEVIYAGTAPISAGKLPRDVRGQILVLYLPGTQPSAGWDAGVRQTLIAGLQAGVSGMIFLLDPAFSAEALEDIARNAASGQAGRLPLSVAFVRSESAEPVFAAAGVDLAQLRQRPATAPVRMQAVPALEARLLTPSQDSAPNVVAILPGSDPTLGQTYVVFSAHMDHVGVGHPDATGDSIYNGADDDASGTTALLELAAAFASLPTRPARSLIFLAVSGEEKGLLGSRHFVEHPPVPLTSVVADINLDMIGRNAPDTVVAIGYDYTSLGPLAMQLAAARPALGLTIAADLWPEERLFFRSDHFSFARKQVPAIFFTTGLHPDYHKPSDEPERIDADKLARVARLVFYLGHAVATTAEPPRWTEKGKAEVGAMGGR